MEIILGDNTDLRTAKIDLDLAMRKLQRKSINLYNTVLGVMVYGNPIQEQAKQMKVSKRQIIRRLDDGLHMLTMIMNGEVH
jgi:CRISPR/Cas system-associated endonuclease Cas3-HD